MEVISEPMYDMFFLSWGQKMKMSKVTHRGEDFKKFPFARYAIDVMFQ